MKFEDINKCTFFAVMKNLEEIAKEIHLAAANAYEIEQISLSQNISIDNAYDIQAQSIAHRITDGETLIGLKMGFTSEAKMQQMGVHDMIWGRLTSSMLIHNQGNTPFSKYIHPRVEPEICFQISKDIDEVLDENQVKEYVSGVAGAIEIIDSRYKNFKFSIEDVVADNCSSIGFVVGDWFPTHTPVKDLKIELLLDGQVSETGNSNDILGDPWKALAACTRLAKQYNQPIKAGMYIMAGAATSAAFVKEGQHVSANIETLGSVSFDMQ